MSWLILILTIPYIYILIRIYSGLTKLKPFHPGAVPPVSLSVVVACRNEEKNLPYLLESLTKQTLGQDYFEVIIIDDNSVDSTFELASGYKKLTNTKVIRNSGKGKKAAIEEGIRQSKNGIIVTTDADCLPGKYWLNTVSVFFAENNPDLLIGPVVIDGGPGLLNRFQELEFLSLQAVTAGTAGNNVPILCNGANLAFTKETYLANKENLHPGLQSGDDVFLLESVRKRKGSRIAWLESPDTLVHTGACRSLRSFIEQRVRWLSKAGEYDDKAVTTTAIVTFVTILLQTALLIGGFFNSELLLIFAVYILLKSVPDILVITNRARRYDKIKLLWYFLPTQFIYPFYVLAVSVKALISYRRFRLD